MSHTAKENAVPHSRLDSAARIVLIRFSSLGDCLLLCPLPRRLKDMGAGEVTVVTKRQYADVFVNTDGVDRVVALDSGAGVRGLGQISSSLAGGGYTVIDAHNTLRSRLLCARLGGADAWLRKNYAARLGLIVFKRRVALPTMLEQYASLAAAITGEPARLEPGGFVIPDAARDAASRWIDPGGPVVALAPGSRWASKRWPAEHFIELAVQMVTSRSVRILLTGDAADQETCARIARDIGDSAIDISGRTSLAETAGCLSRCEALVANDSGLMHLAEAVGVPTVGLFGPTVSAFGYYPSLSTSCTVERDISCRPCSRNGAIPCPKGTQECLADMPVAAVLTAVTGAIEGGGPRRHVLE